MCKSLKSAGRRELENHRLAFSTAFFALFLALVPSSVSAAGPLAKITVEAGKHMRIDTPVSIPLNGISTESRLEEIKGSNRIPVVAQIEAGNPPRLWWILSGTTPAGGKRVYELVVGRPAAVSGVEVRLDDTFLDIYHGRTKVLRYNHAPVPPPEGASLLYTRSGFIHPLWSPAGAILTNIHPADHIHHMGIWMPWTKTEFEGREVDFWNLKKGEGTVRFVEFVSTRSGLVYGGFEAEQEHVALKTPVDKKVVLKETWDVRVYNVGGVDKGYWLWDFTSTQRCASSSPLKLLKYRYGGLGFRATSQWDEDSSDYLTSEGKTRKDGHGTRGRWCNVFGKTAKGPAGILFMSHPQNHEHPEPMRIWPEGEVFFNFCPVQKADWTLEPGETYVLRYRLYVYNGTITAEKAEGLWQDFANPPKISLERQ